MISNDFTIPGAIANSRHTEYDINPLIISRWSARAMTGEKISDEELMQLFEAARWAPSSSNTQPWRFIYAKREDEEEFNALLKLLTGNNPRWCRNASVLILLVAKNHDKESGRTLGAHQFDSGSAFENLALQATSMNLVVHPMGGFDSEAAAAGLGVPSEFTPIVMIAVGRRASKDVLDEDLGAREIPSQRKPVSELIMKGKFDPHKA